MFAANIFDSRSWAMLPPHFWTVVFFCLGAIVGSFLNVCIHRLPAGQSVLRPGSHCPRCGAAIPWRHNLPILSWLRLRGRSACCGSAIRPRYVVIEALTAALFATCWIVFGDDSPALALVYSVLLSGLLAATAIDWEHFIIPDELTIGGIAVGVAASFLVPALHGTESPVAALQRSLLGAVTGGGLIYAVVRGGKVLFGRHALVLPPGAPVRFAEESLVLPDRKIPYEELLYRRSDRIRFVARTVELVDRCYRDVPVEVTRERVKIGPDEFAFEALPGFEAVADRIELPREVMGLGDVKFMAAIGAFLGWQAVLFSLMASALVGAAAGLALIALRRHTRSAPIPYGPFIAAAAAVWVFAGPRILHWWLGGR
jgi:leader peptidase (prepilin peptidase)/N-methyltransferase